MKPYVRVEGSGQDVTTISVTNPNGLSVAGANNSTLANLTITSVATWGLYNYNSASNLEHVTVNLNTTSATGYSYGVQMGNSLAATFTDVTFNVVNASGFTAAGISLGSGGTLTLRDVRVSVSGGTTTNWGLTNNGYSVDIFGGSVAATGTGSTGISSYSGTTSFHHSVVSGGTTGATRSGGTLSMGGGQLVGGVSGTITCAFTYDGSFAELQTTCAP